MYLELRAQHTVLPASSKGFRNWYIFMKARIREAHSFLYNWFSYRAETFIAFFFLISVCIQGLCRIKTIINISAKFFLFLELKCFGRMSYQSDWMVPSTQLKRLGNFWLEAILGEPGEWSSGCMGLDSGERLLDPLVRGCILFLRAGIVCVHACWCEKAHKVECKGYKGCFI